jgi:hypothetical protein
MKRLCLSIIVAAGSTFPAFANPPQLRGDYVFTYNDTCLISPSGFSANAALGQTYSATSAATGIEHFNADGRTGMVTGSSLAVNLGSPPLPANTSTANFSFQFTYAFNADGSFTMTTVPGTFVGNITSAGLPISFNRNSWIGLVSNDAKSHTLTTLTPFVQVITATNTKPPTIIVQQMCRSNVIAFALNPAD